MADTSSSNHFLWYDMQTAIDALEKLLEKKAAVKALADDFPIWGLMFGFMKLLVNKDLSAASKDKHLQTALAYLMVKIVSVARNSDEKATAPATVPAEVPAAVQTAIAKIFRKHWPPIKDKQLIEPRIADVDALFNLVGWKHASPTYARCNRTHMFDGALCDN